VFNNNKQNKFIGLIYSILFYVLRFTAWFDSNWNIIREITISRDVLNKTLEPKPQLRRGQSLKS